MTTKKKTFTSLEKAVDILDLFDMNKREYSAQEISDALKLPLSSIYKYIDFLVNRQLLRHKPHSKMYGLGFMITRLAYIIEKDFDVAKAARPFLEKLCKEVGETAMLTIAVGDEAVCVDCVEPERLVKLSLDPGRRLPLHAGSSSRILLAFQTDGFIGRYMARKELKKLTQMTPVDKEALWTVLRKIRIDGYSISDSEVDMGAMAISVPVRDQKGDIIAGLTVAGPTDRLTQQSTATLVELLETMSIELSCSLGFGVRKRQYTVSA